MYFTAYQVLRDGNSFGNFPMCTLTSEKFAIWRE